MTDRKTHKLKTWPKFFQAVWDDLKSFEIRFNDRAYEVGDRLLLEEFDPDRNVYTGRVISAAVSYLTAFEQVSGFVVMALKVEAKLTKPHSGE